MRLVSIEAVIAGDILGKTIRNSSGRVLLNSGIVLSETLIEKLKEKNISYIYIEDERTKDIVIDDAITAELRQKATETIENTFHQVKEEIEESQSLVLEKATRQLTDLVQQLLSEIKSDKKLLNLLSDVYLYDEYIFTHSLNVTLYSLVIGQRMQLSPRELETLGLGAMLHDVGKMKIRTEILLKPGRLTEAEYLEMKDHAEIGFQILKEVPTLPLLVAHCAYQHHERINGTGYPRGIKGKEIHLYGKIIAVADVFDAVTSNRVYRKAMLPHEGLDILYAGVGTLFDPDVVDAFRKSVAIYPVGVQVCLNDGTKGVVIRQNRGISDRPVIRVLEKDGKQVLPYEIDLTEILNVVIISCNLTHPED